MSIISLEYHEIINNKVEKKQIEFSEYLLKEPYNLSSLFITKVDGQSMQPVINDKALVVADLSQQEYEDEKIFLVSKDNKMWIKKAKIINGEKYYVSINKDFSHLVYKYDDARMIARVLLTFTNL
ncbi:S24 family peptidase [Poseidonibacter sp.]|uniref:S24 family peptidase n=1 Tax=Poseidonibacter sp. TaxID=2321188 RepID=UPI00359CFDF0